MKIHILIAAVITSMTIFQATSAEGYLQQGCNKQAIEEVWCKVLEHNKYRSYMRQGTHLAVAGLIAAIAYHGCRLGAVTQWLFEQGNVPTKQAEYAAPLLWIISITLLWLRFSSSFSLVEPGEMLHGLGMHWPKLRTLIRHEQLRAQGDRLVALGNSGMGLSMQELANFREFFGELAMYVHAWEPVPTVNTVVVPKE